MTGEPSKGAAPPLRLDHVSYATRNTDASAAAFRGLYPRIDVYRALEPSQNVFYTYLGSEVFDHRIELVEPAAPASPVARLIEDRETALYHLSYRTTDFWPAVTYFKSRKFFMVSALFRPELEKDLCVCHFFHPQAGLLEVMGPEITPRPAR
jgi:hypothetical protein